MCAEKYFSVFENGVYVCRADRHDLGVIDGYTLADGRCTVRGKFAKYLLSRRVIYPTADLTGNAERLLRLLVKDRLGIPSRPLSGRILFGEDLNEQKTGGSLLDWALEIAKRYSFSFDIEYDFDSEKLELVVWKGKNRSRSQSSENWIEFSAEWENLAEFSAQRSDREYKNVAIVAGMGKGANRICTVVDICPDSEDRRELWVDAKDIQKEEETTDAEYVHLLTKRGLAKLAEHRISEEFSAVSENSFFSYPDDYDLGDTVTVSDRNYSLSVDCQIIEVDEVFNNGIQQINLKFSNGTITKN